MFFVVVVPVVVLLVLALVPALLLEDEVSELKALTLLLGVPKWIVR